MRPIVQLFAVTAAALSISLLTAAAPAPTHSTAPLRTSASLVLVDVVVTDHDKPVYGLTRSRFHVFEDGREQKIVSFDESRPSPAPNLAAPPAPLPPHTFTNAPLYPPSTAVNVLLLDGLNTPVANQMDVRNKMIKFMGEIPPGTPLAIFTLSSSLHMLAGFTTNPRALVKALDSAKAGVKPSAILDTPSSQNSASQNIDAMVGGLADMTADGGLTSVDGMSALTAMQQFESDVSAFQTDQRVQITLDAMQQLARYLSAIPGRKNLIWFSGSFPISLDPDSSLAEPFEAQRSYSDQIRETDDLLSAARVAVYPVDARGLITPLIANASYTPSSDLLASPMTSRAGRRIATIDNPSPEKDEARFLKQTVAEQASMEQIADDTGGKATMNTNALKQAVAGAIANGSSYYTIGYVPAVKTFDGSFRKIEVRVDSGPGGGYNLQYRNGYYADPPGQATAHNPGGASLIVAATLHGAPPATQIVFDARVLPATDPALAAAKLPTGLTGEMAAQLKPPLRRYVVDFHVSPRQLAFGVLPGGVREAEVEFVLVAYSAAGQRTNYVDRAFAFKIQPAQFAAIDAEGIGFRLALDTPASPGYLRVAVHDLLAARAGSLEVPVGLAPR